MVKSIALFSSGLPDPRQGGSGIFNYLVCKELLARGYKRKGYFRVGQDFMDKHCDVEIVKSLGAAGLEYELVRESPQDLRYSLGSRLLFANHHVDECRQAVRRCIAAGTVDRFISLDFGWALALLEESQMKGVAIMGDPYADRIRDALIGHWDSPSNYWNALKWLSIRNWGAPLRSALRPGVVIGHLSPGEAQSLSEQGVPCRHFRWCTEDVASVPPKVQAADRLVALHVGSLYTTASRSMLTYWKENLFSGLSKLPFTFELRLVGKTEHQVESKWPNIEVKNIGHVESLVDEFKRADLFFSPMKYPVGIRTRVLTAMSYGLPVLADPSIRRGLPEPKHGESIFYCSSTEEVVATLLAAKSDKTLLRKVGEAGRKLWEDLYHPSKSIGAIVDATAAL